jgi:hypothetical protein
MEDTIKMDLTELITKMSRLYPVTLFDIIKVKLHILLPENSICVGTSSHYIFSEIKNNSCLKNLPKGMLNIY